MVKEEGAVLIVLVRRHRRAVGAAVRRAVDDEVPGAVEEEAGPAELELELMQSHMAQRPVLRGEVEREKGGVGIEPRLKMGPPPPQPRLGPHHPRPGAPRCQRRGDADG